MSMIYEPKGRAREYSPNALNLYLKCSHECKYCYAPSSMQRRKEDYFGVAEPRAGVIKAVSKEIHDKKPQGQVLLSFIGDVYCKTTDNNALTREVLELLALSKVPTAILTKGGANCLKDLDIFKKFDGHIQIGATLTFDNTKDSEEWERGAAPPDERLETLKILHENGIKTFASFEPVIYPAQSLNLMGKSLDFVDIYKVGKINNYMGIDKTIDWAAFLQSTIDLLRGADKRFYIKHDLRVAAGLKLFGNEVLPDEFNVT